jgi:uncharacterized protein (DUF924 family)
MSMARQLNRTVFNPRLYSRVRDIWFGDLPWGAKLADQASQDRWFTGTKEEKTEFDQICYNEFNPAIQAISPSQFPINNLLDAEITAPFISEIDQAGDGGGLESTKTALSIMILLDQIPRNLYRTNETLRMVYEHYDKIAVSLARHVTSTAPRLELHPSIRLSMPYRQWFYMPLMHSEGIKDHHLFGKILDEMAAEAKDSKETLESVEGTRKFETMHMKIIERFARYPHRHECLGRTHTEEERKWLDAGGARFGVAG